MRHILKLQVLSLFFAVIALADPSPKPKVTTTTSLLHDMIKQIAGDEIEVISLMGPGVDPHLYKVTPGDIRKLSGADLIVYQGLHLEGRMSEALESFGKRKPTFAAAQKLPHDKLRMLSDIPDPHVWFNVQLWREVELGLAAKLAESFPQLAERMQAGGARYAAELSALDAEVETEISKIPEKRRILVTAHDAFGYFGERYKLKVYGIQGVSTDSEAGLSHIQSLIDLLVNLNVPAVFLESSVGERSIQALTEGARAQGRSVKIAGPLYSDALGELGSGAETYIGMVRFNVKSIVNALGGSGE